MTIFRENHTFDDYFGTLPVADGDATLAHAPNPSLSDHDHKHLMRLNRNASPVKQQYHESDIPAYFAYARQFTLCDWYFSDVAGPSPQSLNGGLRGCAFRYIKATSDKKGHVSHALVSHVRRDKFCQDTFGLPTLNARDAAADGITDCFEFAHAPLGPPSPT